MLTSSPIPVRAEGLTERVGILVLNCSGYNSGAAISGSLQVSLPVAITNRLGSNNQTTDVVVSANLGSGYVPLPVTGQINNQSILLSGISFTVPASGSFSLQISNLRTAAYQLGATSSAPQPINAQVNFPVPLSQTTALVAVAQPGLLATLYDQGEITCTGSPLPSSLTVSNLFSEGTNFASARLTDGFPGAFQPKGTGDDTGTRFLIQYSGFPAGTQLYVPTLVAGSDAAAPTSGGDMGLPQAAGEYVPGSGTLLLELVPYADSTGLGGAPVAAPTGSGPIALNSVSQVNLTGGSGYVVYEVVDANAGLLESAQIPTFIGLANVTAPATANESVSFAPISTVAAASPTAPIPRFEQVTPAGDCTLLGDCNTGYFPHLSVDWTGPVQLTGVAGGPMTGPAYVPVRNTGSGDMQWTATAQYTSGSGWLLLEIDTGTLRIFAVPQALTAGTYQGNVIVDAGPLAGSVTLPVTLVVSPAPAGSGTGTSGSTGSGSGSAAAPVPARLGFRLRGFRSFYPPGGYGLQHRECGHVSIHAAGSRFAGNGDGVEPERPDGHRHLRWAERQCPLLQRHSNQPAGACRAGREEFGQHGGHRRRQQQRPANRDSGSHVAGHLRRRRAEPGLQRQRRQLGRPGRNRRQHLGDRHSGWRYGFGESG